MEGGWVLLWLESKYITIHPQPLMKSMSEGAAQLKTTNPLQSTKAKRIEEVWAWYDLMKYNLLFPFYITSPSHFNGH